MCSVHLSKQFKLLGRTGAWDPQRQHGNSMENLHLRELVKGYKQYAAELGYQKGGAVPLIRAIKYDPPTTRLYLQQQTMTGKEQLLLLRDGFTFSLLWQSCFRGLRCRRREATEHSAAHWGYCHTFPVPFLVTARSTAAPASRCYQKQHCHLTCDVQWAEHS